MTNQQLARRQADQQRLLTAPAPSIEPVHLHLHEHNPVTGDEDGLCALFYEYYRDYTIYSNEEGEGKLTTFFPLKKKKTRGSSFFKKGRRGLT